MSKFNFKDSDLEKYKNSALHIMDEEDLSILNNQLIKEEEKYEILLNKYNKKYLLLLYKNENFSGVHNIYSYKSIENINKYYKQSGSGHSVKGWSLIEKCILNYNPSKKDILSLSEIDIEFLLTEGTWEERAQLLFYVEHYNK